MKRSILKTAIVVAIGFCMQSCKGTYYQVYDCGYDDDIKMQDNSLVYENEDCKILYNLWSEDGNVKFAMYNKTDKDIFVNMSQTFFTRNGLANEYYKGRTYTEQSFLQTTNQNASANLFASGIGFWGKNIYMENGSAYGNGSLTKVIRSSSSSVSVKEKEIVCIPARSFKIFNTYSVNPTWQQTCDNQKDFPKTTYQVGTYSKDNTPITFKNRIAYGFTKNDVADKHIDNMFWLTNITNYSQKAATEKVKDESECYGLFSTKSQRVFKIGGPNKFYKMVQYNK